MPGRFGSNVDRLTQKLRALPQKGWIRSPVCLMPKNEFLKSIGPRRLKKLDSITLAQIAVALVGLALFGMLAWAYGAGDLKQEGEVIWTLPWGRQVMADVYGGFVLLTVLILIVEANWLRGILWSLPLYILGNVWAALWLAYRLPMIIRRLRGETR